MGRLDRESSHGESQDAPDDTIAAPRDESSQSDQKVLPLAVYHPKAGLVQISGSLEKSETGSDKIWDATH